MPENQEVMAVEVDTEGTTQETAYTEADLEFVIEELPAFELALIQGGGCGDR
jgi:hypothetical protein